MSKHFDKLLKTLKTRQDVTALGFSKEELKSLASDIDENLDSIKETATDEDVENAIKVAIDGVIPMLKLAQMQASRIVSKKLKEQDDERRQAEEEDEKKRKADEKPAEGTKNADEGKQKPAEEKKEDDELKSLIKALTEKVSKQDETIAKQNEAMAQLLAGNVKDKRKAILEAKLKGAGKYGSRKMREFERISFRDDSDFNDFLDEIDEDLEDIKAERDSLKAKWEQDKANDELAKQTQQPPAPDKDSDKKDVEVMSDEQIIALAKQSI